MTMFGSLYFRTNDVCFYSAANRTQRSLRPVGTGKSALRLESQDLYLDKRSAAQWAFSVTNPSEELKSGSED
jgi:hypothetical protein